MKRALASYAGAVLLIAISFGWSACEFSGGNRWEADRHDPADYRMTAEYFWGVPITPGTYYPIWNSGWGDYLRTVPFRGIGLGTAYLAAASLRVGHVPATSAEVRAAGLALSATEKVLMAAAVLLIFHVTRRAWGNAAALATVVFTAFPPHFWRMCDDFMVEPAARIVFLLALACAIAMGTMPAAMTPMFVIAGLMLCAAHLKVQWSIAGLLLLPALLIDARARGLSRGSRVLIVAAMAAIPISVMLVNWIGWRTTRLNSGLGIHLNLKFNGDVLRSYADTIPADRRPPFADPARPTLEWWNIYVGPPATRADYDDFDRYASAYLRAHPAAALAAFGEGLAEASTIPAIQSERDKIIRLAPLEEPWRLLVRILDCFVWAALIAGVCFEATRVACALALVLWIVPAIGNIVSLYDFRYHMPMAGIGAAAATGVVARLLRQRGERARPRFSRP